MFLQNDLEAKIIQTAERLMEKYKVKKDKVGISECQKLIQMAEENPYKKIDTKKWLQEITVHWQELTQAVKGIGIPK